MEEKECLLTEFVHLFNNISLDWKLRLIHCETS